MAPNTNAAKRGSFVRRLTLRFALLVTLTTVAVLIVGGWLLKRQGTHSLEIMQRIEAGELAEILGTGAELSTTQITHRFEDDADSDFALYFIQVNNERNEVVFKSANLGESFFPPMPPGSAHTTVSVPGAGTVRVVEKKSGPWRIMVGSALAPVSHILNDYMRIAAVLVAAVAVLSLLSGYAFSRMTLEPVRAIERTARRIRADNLSERITVPDTHGELADLAALLNRTFDHLETAFAQVRRFSADASHELKTPLALIRLNAEKLRARVAGDPEADAQIADLLEEIDRMKRIIESLLFIAKVEGGALVIERRPHDMPAFLADFAEDARVLAEDRGLRFELRRNDAGTASIDPNSLRQLLLNLASNAIAATPKGGLITFDSERTTAGWRLTMTDEGFGLPPEMLERVFERFTRHQPSASGEGHGLGLAICRSIADLHGGTIRAENRADRGGLRLIFEW